MKRSVIEELRKIIEKAMQSVDGNEALTAKCLYPEWEPEKEYLAAFKVKRNGNLYRCIQQHSSMEGWEPEKAPALWEEVNEVHDGSLEDPIPYNGNMALTAGLYYIQTGVVYLCIRDTVSPVYSSLEELTGLYVETVG